MKLRTTQLKEGENQFSYESRKQGWLREVVENVGKQGVRLQPNLKLDLSLTKLEPDYYLRGKVDYELEQVCDRCAESYAKSIAHQFELALTQTEGERTGTDLAGDSDELDVTSFHGEEIDLGPILEEQIFLGIPYRSLCAQECKGICQQCGQNLNQKPCSCPKNEEQGPFAVLQRLRNKE